MSEIRHARNRYWLLISRVGYSSVEDAIASSTQSKAREDTYLACSEGSRSSPSPIVGAVSPRVESEHCVLQRDMIDIGVNVIGIAQAPVLIIWNSYSRDIVDAWSVIGIEEIGVSSIEIYSSLAAIQPLSIRIGPACVIESTGWWVPIVIGIEIETYNASCVDIGIDCRLDERPYALDSIGCNAVFPIR